MRPPTAARSEQAARAVRVTSSVTPGPAPVETWKQRLEVGNRDGAWDAFLEAYRALIFSTIGRVVRDPEDRMDVFALVCERLREDDLRRLRAYDVNGPARFSTWLVTVVRNLAVDWHRSRSGRRRPSVFESRLSTVQQTLFRHLSGSGMSYVEAYESMRGTGAFGGTFGAFLREVRSLHRAVFADAGPAAREIVGSDPAVELGGRPVFPEDDGDEHRRVREALETLPDDVRAAVLLFVVDDVPADQVARIVGWPNRKAVYNRVHRALAGLRRSLGADPA